MEPRLSKLLPFQGGGLQSTSYLGPQQGVGTGVNILPGFTHVLFEAGHVCLSMEQTAPWYRLWFPPHRADVCRGPDSPAVVTLQQMWQETVLLRREGGTASQATSLERSKHAK